MASNKDLLARVIALEKANKTKDEQIKLLKTKVESLDELLELKSNTIKVLKENIDMVQQKANRTEQYTMRPNLRINGVLAKKGETNEEVVAIVKEISEELGV